MKKLAIVVADRSRLVASDVQDEIAELSPEADICIAGSVEAVQDCVDALERVDLLVVSDDTLDEQLTMEGRESALKKIRTILRVGETGTDRAGQNSFVAEAPFTSATLRRDLLEVTVCGVPLFRP